ncbi:hypothetical protein [Microbacterium sp. GXF6406]
MTDARLPSRWMADRRFARLAPEHFVSYTWALMYAVESGTDGRLEQGDLEVILRYRGDSTEVLIAAGLFGRDDDGALQILDYPSTQSTAAEVKAADDRRVKERLRKREQRGRRRQPGTTEGDSDATPPAAEPTWDVASIPDVDSWEAAGIDTTTF